MSELVIIAVDATETARSVWGRACPDSVALSAGLVGLLQQGSPRLELDVVAGALGVLHPDGWKPSGIPGVFTVQGPDGGAFLAVQGSGVVIGLAGEMALALAAKARVQRFEATGPVLQ